MPVKTDFLNFVSVSEDAVDVAEADEAVGQQNLFSMLNCLDFYDAEPALERRTFEGNQTAADVRRAYGASSDSLLLQDQRFFAFAGRGVALFASFAQTSPVSVVPLIKA
eukprot:tig00020560_g11069.t1